MREKKKLAAALALAALIALGLFLWEARDRNAGRLTIAYLPNEGSSELADLRAGMAEELSAALGLPVEELICTDYNAAIEALRFGHADLALLGAVNVIQAREHAQASPIVMVAEGGSRETAGYKSLFIVRSDSAIRSLQDLKGCSVAFVDPTSTSGNLIPCAEILAANPGLDLTIEDLNTPGRYFSDVFFAGQHLNGVLSVLNREVDLAFCASDTYQKILDSGQAGEGELSVIFESRTIPSSAFVVRDEMDASLREKLVDFLVDYDNPDYFGQCLWDPTARFVECTYDDYSGFEEIADLLGAE